MKYSNKSSTSESKAFYQCESLSRQCSTVDVSSGTLANAPDCIVKEAATLTPATS